jgi:hypothetical protein
MRSRSERSVRSARSQGSGQTSEEGHLFDTDTAQVMVQLAGEVERAIDRLPVYAFAEIAALRLMAAGLRHHYGGELAHRRRAS